MLLRFFSLRLWLPALLLCMFGSVFLFIYDAWDSLNLLNMLIDAFHEFWKILSLYLFRYCFCPTLLSF